MKNAQTSFTLEDLKREIKICTINRIAQGTALLIASVALAGAVKGEQWMQIVAAAGGFVSIGLVFTGSAKLADIVKSMPVSATAEYMEALSAASWRLIARYPAWKRQAELLPKISPKIARSIRPRVWNRFYAFALSAPPEERIAAFDAAILAKDKKSITELEKILYSFGVTEEIRDEMKIRIAKV